MSTSNEPKKVEYFWPAISTETFYGGPYATEGCARHRDAYDPDAAKEIQTLKDRYKAEKDGHWAEISTVEFLGVPAFD